MFLPIRIMTLLGVCVFLVSLGLLGYVFFSWVFGQPRPGWTSQMLVSTFFFGIQFLLMGIVGEYLYRIYCEVTRRPLFFVSESTPQGPETGDGY